MKYDVIVVADLEDKHGINTDLIKDKSYVIHYKDDINKYESSLHSLSALFSYMMQLKEGGTVIIVGHGLEKDNDHYIAFFKGETLNTRHLILRLLQIYKNTFPNASKELKIAITSCYIKTLKFPDKSELTKLNLYLFGSEFTV